MCNLKAREGAVNSYCEINTNTAEDYLAVGRGEERASIVKYMRATAFASSPPRWKG